MEDQNEMTGIKSLAIIQQMIDTAKKEQKDDGKGWIIWGWMLFIASVTTILNIHFEWGGLFLFWNIFGGITIVLAIYEIIRNLVIKKQPKVKTYTMELLGKLNTGFFFCLMFIIVAMNVGIRPVIGFPLLMNLYAFWVLIYGAVLNFRPSIVGAFITWALAFSCLFVRTFEGVMIMHAAAVLSGYIIPGHLANREFKKLHRSSSK